MSIDNQPNESCDCVFPHFVMTHTWHTPQGGETCHTVTSTGYYAYVYILGVKCNNVSQ